MIDRKARSCRRRVGIGRAFAGDAMSEMLSSIDWSYAIVKGLNVVMAAGTILPLCFAAAIHFFDDDPDEPLAGPFDPTAATPK
jgi:hypothetical protein